MKPTKPKYKQQSAEQIRLMHPEELRSMRKEGMSQMRIAIRCGVSSKTIFKRCAEYGIDKSKATINRQLRGSQSLWDTGTTV